VPKRDSRERTALRDCAQKIGFAIVFLGMAALFVGMAVAWRQASPVRDAVHTVPWRQNEVTRYLTPGQDLLYRNLMRWPLTVVFTVGPLLLAWVAEPALPALGRSAQKDLEAGRSPFRPLRAALLLTLLSLVGLIMAAGGGTAGGVTRLTLMAAGWVFVLIPAVLTAVGLARVWWEGKKAVASRDFARFLAAFLHLRRTLYTLMLLGAGAGLCLGYPLLLLTMFVTLVPTTLFFRKIRVHFGVETEHR